ncbi:AP-3 complex subunit beta-1 isoform X1 [Acyrthosiphon pisum]|uniref:AP-3 complex subunit beta n=1 Tax=Acyrthosiphon pisum TaxID=7029 RepID=A0A8R1W6Z4_ACYPI|nr:AP-3 complex subunit beta-1 isoform X1 [Acyrthosiphon pisum]|eukprot:XP_001948771.2 PREDICTED: AP-3 complex subunit beta-1 isoform X1 [Acyrthosiphon pisum]
MNSSSATNYSNMSSGTNGTYDKNGLSSSTTGDGDYSSDPASGGLSSFFVSDYKKHDDLKQMLDSAKDGPKLEAMKRIIGMIAKGRDASELFPAVVKNVVSKNIEVKKLVYVYLVRYAEQQQDLALLSISTFQRALKDPNQLIRASALRVLSSIRVVMIVPIVMLAIKDSAADMSPYVRKTAAHAIPKLYSLDPDQKEELITVIEKLLADKSTLVVGSTVMAFEEVCPERIDLIHKIYRKLCNLLVDIDEWGQVIIVNMLTRYGRTQFVNPNKIDTNDCTKIQNSNLDSSDLSSCEEAGIDDKSTVLDQDHRLLLRNAKPLFQSRNAAVVMSVAQLYHHLAPKSEVNVIAKALIRLLRSHREVQSVVLNSIASISIARKNMFEPYLKSFFVRSNDPTHIKLLKLDIMTNLANETSISTILREVQTYISSTDKQFVAAAIQAIGRCASNIKEVTETCLSGLVSMLSSRDEAVVAESVVVIKKLLQNQPEAHCDIIRHMARLMDSIAVPQARASILWLLGEYSQLVSTIAPDVLRKVAKTYVTEEDIVKLQIMNLAVKLFLTNPAQTTLLCQYVLKQAKYDQNYDIRDRSRFLNNILFPTEQFKDSVLSKHANNIFLAEKPAPLLQSNFVDREEYQMGSLSHYINSRAIGYQDLPQFPDFPTDSSVRCVALPEEQEKPVKQKSERTTINKKKTFYSDSENNSNDSSEESDDSDDSTDSSSDSTYEKIEPEMKTNAGGFVDSDEDSSDSESVESDSSDEHAVVVHKNVSKPSAKSNVDLLLELDDFAPVGQTTLVPSFGNILSQSSSTQPSSIPVTKLTLQNVRKTVAPSYVPSAKTEILNKINGHNELSILARFTRSPHAILKMVSVELTLTNHDNKEALTNIHWTQKSSDMSIHNSAPIMQLLPGSVTLGALGVDYKDSIQPLVLEVSWSTAGMERKSDVVLRVPVGELVQPLSMSEDDFVSEQVKLKGMNEHMAQVTLKNVNLEIQKAVFEIFNVARVITEEENIFRFSGQTLSSNCLVLLTITKQESLATVCVNCEKMVIGSVLLNEIKGLLSQ